jgi:hypothetical protein
VAINLIARVPAMVLPFTKPAMDDALYGSLVETLSSKGYDPSRLMKTPQPEGL